MVVVMMMVVMMIVITRIITAMRHATGRGWTWSSGGSLSPSGPGEKVRMVVVVMMMMMTMMMMMVMMMMVVVMVMMMMMVVVVVVVVVGMMMMIATHSYETRYREGLDLVLRGITFTIRPGEKVRMIVITTITTARRHATGDLMLRGRGGGGWGGEGGSPSPSGLVKR